MALVKVFEMCVQLSLLFNLLLVLFLFSLSSSVRFPLFPVYWYVSRSEFSLCLIGSSFDLIQLEFSVPLKLYVEVCLCFDSAGKLEHTPIVLCFLYLLFVILNWLNELSLLPACSSQIARWLYCSVLRFLHSFLGKFLIILDATGRPMKVTLLSMICVLCNREFPCCSQPSLGIVPTSIIYRQAPDLVCCYFRGQRSSCMVADSSNLV
jgi:hypothetical protein